MAVVQILAFLLAVLGIAKKFQLKFVEAVPIGTSLLVMLLYGLSFFRALSLSDYLAAAFLLFVLIRFIRASRDEKRNMLSFGKDCLTEGGALTALLMTAVVTICVGSKLVSWWDDYNFWATDVKSIYYLDGFAGKYTNVAPEFGDYPPATQMIKWWFLHFSPGQFKEGLMFGGYYFMMLSFLFPLLSFLQKKKRLIFCSASILTCRSIIICLAQRYGCLQPENIMQREDPLRRSRWKLFGNWDCIPEELKPD